MSAAARVLPASRPSLVERAQARAAGSADPLPAIAGGEGARVWDSRGRRYLDFCNRDGAVILGHADPLVAAAMADPAGDVADEAQARLRALIPFAETAAFARSAPAALLSALRMARLATGRERGVVVSSGLVSGAGGAIVAADLHELRAVFARDASIAAVVIDPMGLSVPELAAMAALARAQRALVIFDERRSALRVHKGGAATLFGVRPDLAVVGGSIGNGAQVAAVVGVRAVFETSALPSPPDAAALAAVAATLRRVDVEPVVATLAIRGAEVEAEVEALIAALGAGDQLHVAGDPSWSSLVFASPALRADFLRAAPAAGLYTLGDHVMSYAHGDASVTDLLAAYAQILPPLLAARSRAAS